MRKKLIVFMLILIVAASFLFTGCNKEPLKIVFLGDSISEGIAGMSPLSERDRYAYYGVLGEINGYEFKNRAVSGSMTKDLLAYIQQEDNDARLVRTNIAEADIIQISILGNDLLLNDMGKMIIDTANEDFEYLDSIIDTARANIASIVAELKSLNSDGVIFFQNVYNPIFEDSMLVNVQSRAALSEMDIQPSEYRELGAVILSKLNGVLTEYLEEHPGAFYIIDSYAEFDRIYKEDAERGKALVFSDDIHPSVEGHAVLSDINQAKLEELNLADKKSAVKLYKELRIEQLERMFGDSVDVKAVKKQINNAESCPEITEIYFDAIRGKTPIYY